jgi:tetratricopeptide (TPR) repeat protein
MPQEEIEQTLRDALAIEPDHVGARVQLVQDLWNRKDYDEVIALCRPAQEYNPDEMAFYYFQGLAHFQKDEQDEALDVFRKGVSQIKEDSNPDIVSDFYAIMGDILHQKGRDEEAFASYDSCLHWKDDNIGALNNYAYYLSIRKYTKAEDQRAALDKAEQMSRKTIQAEPANSTYLDTYAWILFLQGRYPEAKNYIEQAIANSDDLSGVVKEHAGDIYAVNGDIPRAMEFWQQAADGGSDSPTLHKKIAQKRYIEE